MLVATKEKAVPIALTPYFAKGTPVSILNEGIRWLVPNEPSCPPQYTHAVPILVDAPGYGTYIEHVLKVDTRIVIQRKFRQKTPLRKWCLHRNRSLRNTRRNYPLVAGTIAEELLEFSSACTAVAGWQEVGSLNIKCMPGDADSDRSVFRKCPAQRLCIAAVASLVYEEANVYSECGLIGRSFSVLRIAYGSA